jgi:hypothetical protein
MKSNVVVLSILVIMSGVEIFCGNVDISGCRL